MSEPAPPRDEADVVAAVAAAHAAGRPLELVAGGSRRQYGRRTENLGTLDLSRISGVRLYEPDELVMTALPATPIRTLRELLAQQGQHLAFEPPDFGPLWGGPADAGTLGGCLSVGLGGPRRPFAGAPRDHFLGFRAVNGRGEAFAGGGRVVKNVTGYDMPKLLAGSLGTLAALTEVTLKVLPLPETSCTLALRGLTNAGGLAFLRGALGGPAQITGAAHLPPGELAGAAGLPWREDAATLIRLEGVAESILSRIDLVMRDAPAGVSAEVIAEGASQALWRGIGDLALLTDRPGPVWRISIPPAQAASCAALLADRLAGRLFFDWGGGLIWLQTDGETPQQAQTVRNAVTEIVGAHGHATLLRGGPSLRTAIAPIHPLEPALAALTLRVKTQFDPKRLLNPGRMYEGV